MKSFKKFLGLLIILMLLFVGVGDVHALDNSVKVSQKRNLQGVDQYQGAKTSYKAVTTSAGEFLGYCLNKENKAPEVGSQLSYDKELTTPSLIYILNNGFNGTNWNTDLLGNDKSYSNDEKYYITQLAIWLAQGTFDKSKVKTGGHIGSQALKLYNAAMNFKVTVPGITLSDGGKMTLSSDEHYYVSKAIKLGGQGYDKATITLVNAPAEAKIVYDGKSYDSNVKIPINKSFTVSIPASKLAKDMTISVRATAQGTTKKIYQYSANDPKVQNIGLMFNNPVTVSAGVQLTVQPRGKIIVYKYDTSTGKNVPLAGAELTLYASNGKKLISWISNTTPETIVVEPGVYTIKETKAPKGFYIVDPIKINVPAGSPVVVSVGNYKFPSKIKISKQDITTKAELPGAHLVLKNALGKVVDEWDSTTTPHYIEKLTPGKYTLSETIAPTGYLLTTETVTFTVDNDGGVEKPIVMYNTPIPKKTLIKVSKRDITNDKELPGAKLTVKDANGKVVDEWVSTTTPHYLADLPEGKYVLIETKSPDGYGISDEIVEFEVTADGGVEKTVVMYNSPIPETADMNITLIVAGLIGTVALAGFSIFKLNRQHA